MERLKLNAGAVREMILDGLAGDDIDGLKETAKFLAVTFSCRVVFSHNQDSFIADSQGNVAQTNHIMDHLINLTRK